MSINDEFSIYENGFNLLLQHCDQNHSSYQTLLLLQLRMQEVIGSQREFGKNSNDMAECHRILAETNKKCIEITEKSFNEWCDNTLNITHLEQSSLPTMYAVIQKYISTLYHYLQQGVNIFKRNIVWTFQCERIKRLLQQSTHLLSPEMTGRTITSDPAYPDLIVDLYYIYHKVQELIICMDQYLSYHLEKMKTAHKRSIHNKLLEITLYIYSNNNISRLVNFSSNIG